MNVAALQRRYQEVFGEAPASAHRQFLFRKIVCGACRRLRSLPVAYAPVEAARSRKAGIVAVGEAGGEIRGGRAADGTDCRMEMAQRDVWLLFTKKLTPGGEGRARVTGDRRWAEPFFLPRAVMG